MPCFVLRQGLTWARLSSNLHVAKDDLGLLILPPLSPVGRDYRQVSPCLIYVAQEIKGFMHIRQVFYQLSHIPSLIFLVSEIQLNFRSGHRGMEMNIASKWKILFWVFEWDFNIKRFQCWWFQNKKEEYQKAGISVSQLLRSPTHAVCGPWGISGSTWLHSARTWDVSQCHLEIENS